MNHGVSAYMTETRLIPHEFLFLSIEWCNTLHNVHNRVYCASFILISCAGILAQENTLIYTAKYGMYNIDIPDLMYLQCAPVCVQ